MPTRRCTSVMANSALRFITGSSLVVTGEPVQRPCRGRTGATTAFRGAGRAALLFRCIRRVLPRRNTGRAVGALASLTGVFGTASADPIAPAVAIETFDTVESWVRAGAVEEAAGLPPVEAVSIVLRRNGEIVAEAAIASPTSPGDSAMIAEAAELVLGRIRRLVPRGGDALDAERAEDFRGSLALDLELADRLVPFPGRAFITEEGDPLRAARPALDPGLDGFAAQFAGNAAAVPPGAFVRSDVDARAAFERVVQSVLDDPQAVFRPPEELRGRGVRFYRFETVHLVQDRPSAAPRFRHRGGTMTPIADVQNTRSLIAMAEGIAVHLLGRRWPGVEPYGMMGDLDPITGRHEPVAAPPFEQALAAAALLRASRVDFIDTDLRARCRDAAIEVLVDLHAAGGAETPFEEAGPVAAAATAWAISLLHAGDSEEIAALRTQSSAMLEAAFDPGAGFMHEIPDAARGLIALGLVSNAERDSELERADAAIRTVFRSTEPERLVSQMPYLLWAELALAERRGLDAPPAATALTAMRDLVLRFQLRRDDLDPRDLDLAGGIVFTRARQPLPTSQSLRAIAALSTMLAEPSLTSGDARFATLLTRQIEMTRFVRQLAAGPGEAYMYRRPRKAVWGVRTALWDQSMPTEASALALISVCDTIEAIQRE